MRRGDGCGGTRIVWLVRMVGVWLVRRSLLELRGKVEIKARADGRIFSGLLFRA